MSESRIEIVGLQIVA